jgi:hypothetical protein
MAIAVPTNVVCGQSQTMMGGIESNDLWGNCEQSKAGTLNIGGIVIQKRTKCWLSWPAKNAVLKFYLNCSPYSATGWLW